jgi:hypothetical protein
MKHIKTFEGYESPEWQGHKTESEEGDQFARIIPNRKIDKNFEITAELIANLILNCAELSKLKELAMGVRPYAEYQAGNGAPKEYFAELDKCFPCLDLHKTQIVNTGTKIPFYGRAKKSHLGFVDNHSADITLSNYIAHKVQEPGYKY